MPFTLADIQLSKSSTRTPTDGTLADTSEDGVTRVRIMYSTTQYNFKCKTVELTSSQVTDLISYYNTNKTTNVTLTWPSDSETYTVKFLGRPVVKDSKTHGMFEAEFELAGVES